MEGIRRVGEQENIGTQWRPEKTEKKNLLLIYTMSANKCWQGVEGQTCILAGLNIHRKDSHPFIS
jgi:hypothetical protein